MWNTNKLSKLISRIEYKLDNINLPPTKDDARDILLTQSILEYILSLAVEDREKASDTSLIATDDEIWNLTHDE